jgi:hypothetical protein
MIEMDHILTKRLDYLTNISCEKNLSIINLLLEAGARVGIVNNEGKPPLQIVDFNANCYENNNVGGWFFDVQKQGLKSLQKAFKKEK